jgi:hypothetical protein
VTKEEKMAQQRKKPKTMGIGNQLFTCHNKNQNTFLIIFFYDYIRLILNDIFEYLEGD